MSTLRSRHEWLRCRNTQHFVGHALTTGTRRPEEGYRTGKGCSDRLTHFPHGDRRPGTAEFRHCRYDPQAGLVVFNEYIQALPQAGVSETASLWGASSVSARPLNLRNLGSNHSLRLGLQVINIFNHVGEISYDVSGFE